MIQSQLAIWAKSSSKLPVVMRFANRFEYKGDGLDLMAALRWPSAMEFRGPSAEGRSSKSTSDPVWARWHAMRDPITPEPNTAARLIL